MSCNVLPADTTAPVATWPLLETLCCRCSAFFIGRCIFSWLIVLLLYHVRAECLLVSCLCSLFDRDISNQRDSSAQAQRMLLASSIHRFVHCPFVRFYWLRRKQRLLDVCFSVDVSCRLALRAAAGAAAPFLSRCSSVDVVAIFVRSFSCELLTFSADFVFPCVCC